MKYDWWDGMLFAVICDDDREAAVYIEKLLRHILEKNCVQYKLEVYSSGEELVRHVRSLQTADLILLDYKMNHLSGVEVAKILRDNGVEAKIMFISSVVEAAPMGYELGVFRYLIKGRGLADSFTQSMQKVIEHYRAPKEFFTFQVNHEAHSVMVKDILYLEIINRKIKLAIIENESSCQSIRFYEFYSRLAAIESNLETCGFCRIHRSYLANLQHVQRIVSKPHATVFLQNDVQLPISKARFPEVKRKVMEWMITANA